MATNNSANIITAAAGKVLQGAGVGVAPAYSTPTYPSTSGTSRKILVSDGTNNVYSTETWAVPGTSGNVLTSDGTNWTSAAPGSAISTSTTTLTSAQIKALHGTPIQLIAAPGAGKTIVVVAAMAKFTYGGTNVFTTSGAQSIGVYYNSGTTAVLTGANFVTNAMVISSANKFSNVVGVSNTNVAAGVVDNVNVVAFNSVVTEIAGNAANNNTCEIILYYYTVTY